MSRRTEVGIPTERQGSQENGNGTRGFIEAELHGADEAVFSSILGETIRSLDDADIPYAIIGGIASSGFGRPRWTHDIDIFVQPHDAERALEALGSSGFKTEKTDVTWIFKAFKSNVMVDLIFRSTGGFYLDDEMMRRGVRGSFKGHAVRFIPPEDLLVIKAVVHDEAGPRHWHDALGIVSNAELDWDYLLRRARRAPRRVLSLLTYAQSMDLQVPNRVIRRLFDDIYNS